MCLDAETRRCLASMSRLPLQLVCTARDCTPKQMESRLNLPKGQEEQVVGKHSAVGQGNSLFSDGRKRLANGPPGRAQGEVGQVIGARCLEPRRETPYFPNGY